MSEHTCSACPVCGNSAPGGCDYCEGFGRIGACERCVELLIAEEELGQDCPNCHASRWEHSGDQWEYCHLSPKERELFNEDIYGRPQ